MGLNVAVFGLGSMGRNHVRILRQSSVVEDVVGIDPDPGARDAIARVFRIETAESLAALGSPDLDAAVIATPSSSHRDLALDLLRLGVPCLIEKPLAPSVAVAQEIAAVADGTPSMVGHVERFNPAISALKARIGLAGRLLSVACRRVGPYPVRIRDVGVGFDLLTHDFDIVRFITGRDVLDVHGEAESFLGPEQDCVYVVGRLEGGALLSLEASWLSPRKIREVTVIGEQGSFVADTLFQDLYFYENAEGAAGWDALATFRGVAEGNVTKFALHREEPLQAELEAFLLAVETNGRSPVPCSDGVEAVRLTVAATEGSVRR